MEIKLKGQTFQLFFNNDDLFNENAICQHCHGFIGIPFYLCQKSQKWFCKECQLKEGLLKEKDFLCIHERYDTHHEHICIKEVIKNESESI